MRVHAVLPLTTFTITYHFYLLPLDNRTPLITPSEQQRIDDPQLSRNEWTPTVIFIKYPGCCFFEEDDEGVRYELSFD